MYITFIKLKESIEGYKNEINVHYGIFILNCFIVFNLLYFSFIVLIVIIHMVLLNCL